MCSSDLLKRRIRLFAAADLSFDMPYSGAPACDAASSEIVSSDICLIFSPKFCYGTLQCICFTGLIVS